VSLLLPKPERIRSRPHLRFVAGLACLACGARPVEVHHLTRAQPKARGLKAGDQWTVPVCPVHHRAIHAAGDEAGWWARWGINAAEAAAEYWAISPARKAAGLPENLALGARAAAVGGNPT
jgi:hypothetical protein